MRQEAVEALKAAPPVGYIGTTLAGMDWSEAASIAALVYTLWLLAEKVWKLLAPRYKAWRAKRGL
jgi:hypothetical protein